jgi:hypothetical protein
MPSSPWVTELRANLRKYKADLEKRGLLGEKLGVTSDRKKRLDLLEKTIGLEDEISPLVQQSVQQNPVAGVDDAFEPTEEEEARELAEQKQRDEQARKYRAFDERQKPRNHAIRVALKKMGSPIPDDVKITSENREEYLHKICEYALNGEEFGDPLTRKGRDGKPSELFKLLDTANKSYTTQLHATLNAKNLSEQEKCDQIGQLTAELESAKERESTLKTENAALESQNAAHESQLEKTTQALANAERSLKDEKNAVKTQKSHITEDQNTISSQQRTIVGLEKKNNALEKENSKQASEIAELKSANEGLRARFFSFIISFLGFLHTEKNIKITGEGPFNTDTARGMVEDFRTQAVAERKKQEAAAAKKGGQPAPTSSSWFDLSSWGTTFFGSSEPAKTSHHRPHAATAHHSDRADAAAKTAGHHTHHHTKS